MTDIEWTPVKIRLGCLDHWAGNPKILTKAQARKLEKSSRKLGRAGVLLVGPEQDGRRPLYDGHQRANIWRGLYGLDADVWALESDRALTDAERQAVSVMTVTATGAFDWDVLSAWSVADLMDFGLDTDALADWKANLTGLGNFLESEKEPPQDAEPQIDRAAELNEKWQVKPGDLFRIGDHRLLCGDSTKREDVERVMGGERAKLFATDPPYGVAYNDETGNKNGDTIANDENDGPKLQAFLESAFLAWLPSLDKNTAWYLWHAQMTQGFFAAAAAAADILIHRQIIWVKPSLIMGHGDYHWKHELCFYGWVKGNRPPFYGERNQTTTWEVGRHKDTPHPTEKPFELWDAPMKNHTKTGDVCAEPFAGSGSQFVAGQNFSRKVYGMEQDPKWCAVILERMATAFPGIEIERL